MVEPIQTKTNNMEGTDNKQSWSEGLGPIKKARVQMVFNHFKENFGFHPIRCTERVFTELRCDFMHGIEFYQIKERLPDKKEQELLSKFGSRFLNKLKEDALRLEAIEFNKAMREYDPEPERTIYVDTGTEVNYRW